MGTLSLTPVHAQVVPQLFAITFAVSSTGPTRSFCRHPSRTCSPASSLCCYHGRYLFDFADSFFLQLSFMDLLTCSQTDTNLCVKCYSQPTSGPLTLDNRRPVVLLLLSPTKSHIFWSTHLLAFVVTPPTATLLLQCVLQPNRSRLSVHLHLH